MRPCAIGWHAIRARQHGRRKVGDGCGVCAHVSPVIVKELVIDPENAAIFVDRGPDLVALLARMIGGDQMLAAIFNPFYGFPELQRRSANEDVLRIHLAANAEAAADMTLVELHLVRLSTQHE